MDLLIKLVVLLGAVCAVAALAGRVRLPAAILLVVAGIALSFVPGFPVVELDPDAVLFFFLPPLLYAAAWQTSLPDFKANLRSIGLLSVGLVLFTTVSVGLVAHLVVPGLSLAEALVLGAIVAPPDAVAATAIARRAGLPRRIVAVLEGESLLNDATALVCYRMGLAAVASGGVSGGEIALDFVRAALGGVAIGAAAAWGLGWVRRHTGDPVLDNALSLLTPFLVYAPAEKAHASGVVAVVTAGLWLGHRAPTHMSAESRLMAEGIWAMVEFLLQGVVFLLIGLQLQAVLGALSGYDAVTVAGASVAVLATVLLGRFVWVFPATYLARLLPRVRERDPRPPWQAPMVISWAGMRGVVSLAAAFGLQEAFPDRDLLLFVTFVVIASTLVLQGLSLPLLIRRLRLPPPDPMQDALAEAAAQQAAASAAEERLAATLDGEERDPPAGVVERLRERTEMRRFAAWERLGDHTSRETPSAAYRRLRREMVQAERAVFIRMRDEGRVEEEILRRVLRDLDLEESLLLRD